MSRHVKRIEVDDVYVGLDQWSTEELIDELRQRVQNHDQAALDFMCEAPAADPDQPFSTAALVSRLHGAGIDLRDIVACPALGPKAIESRAPGRRGSKKGTDAMSFAAWNFDMSMAPRDNTLLMLLVDYTDCANDTRPTHFDEETWPIGRTLGFNNFANDEIDEWKFAGWCWAQDHFIAGKGKPIAWMFAPPPPPNTNIDARRDDGEWIEEEGGKSRLALNEGYSGDARRVFLAVLVAGSVEVTQDEVEAWTLEQRKVAAEWAISVHYSASDNDDVIVPPRPEFVRRPGDAQ
ncbi:MAG: hypothetical protein ACREH4_08205 [Vitreimonas sp.]